jgi:hypothetical protein
MYVLAGRLDAEEAWREAVQRSGDPLVFGRSLVVITRAGQGRASDAALDPDTLVEEARAVGWPASICIALLARGMSRLADDPLAALRDLRESVAAADGVRDVITASRRGATSHRPRCSQVTSRQVYATCGGPSSRVTGD